MINLNDYKNSGWGLSKKTFEVLQNLLQNELKSLETINVLEYGSGFSTVFLSDVLKNMDVNYSINSFDHTLEYSPKVEDGNLKLHVVNLEECNDKAFRHMFINKHYNAKNFTIKKTKPTTRQKNVFYSLKGITLPNNINLMILDGNHGNGRNISFLHLLSNEIGNTYVLIDDLSHYDYEERLMQLFDVDIISKEIVEMSSGIDMWNDFANYGLYKIKNKR